MRLPRLALSAWWSGAQHLQQHEDGADQRERAASGSAPLHRADEQPHGDREHRRQQAAQQQHGPPGGGQRAVGPRQGREELPLLPLAQPPQHKLEFTVTATRWMMVGAMLQMKKMDLARLEQAYRG